MDKKKVIETLFDRKIIKILRLFVNNPERQYYLREIARVTKVPPASAHRIILQLKELELIIEYKDRYLKTYVANEQNLTIFSSILEDKKSAIQEFADFIKTVEGVDMAIQHGKEERDKVSVLIVGEGINQNLIRDRTNEIKEKYKFNIIYLLLSPIQYDQMASMGLYPGKKIILWQS
ncbi:MAG: helix-turn-helix domain-containing protein [Candidatus Woesearchaeota archaeon]